MTPIPLLDECAHLAGAKRPIIVTAERWMCGGKSFSTLPALAAWLKNSGSARGGSSVPRAALNCVAPSSGESGRFSPGDDDA